MKLNKYAWEMYRRTDCPSALKTFEVDMPSPLLFTYNPKSSWRIMLGNFQDIAEMLLCWLDDANKPTTPDEAESLYRQIVEFGVRDVEADPSPFTIIRQGDYKQAHDLIEPLSVALWKFAPDWFFPYFFVNRFADLIRLADAFEIELPEVPHKADHEGRYLYYWELCRTFNSFRSENSLSNEELCAFLYDFAPRYVENGKERDILLPAPQRAWMIGGCISDFDKEAGLNLWQANPETQRGDILVHYETSPISAITHIWRAASDGVIDPFFHYAAQTILTNEIEIPHISLAELKTDIHFHTHPLVRKNLQGVNGWPLTFEDYARLMEMLAAKGYDTTKLPPAIRATNASWCENRAGA